MILNYLFQHLKYFEFFIDLLFPIASGLVYDSIPTVEMVLTTLLEKVIKLDISKTLKLYAMNTVFLRCLLTLYKWLGPRNIIKTYKEKKRKLAFSSKEVRYMSSDAANAQLVIFLTIFSSVCPFQN